jgi:hypothetical protein
MLLNSYLLNIYPPLKYLPHNNKVYLAVDGKTEVEGPGMVENRPFLLTLVDPFDLVGLATGQDHKNRFWEHDGIGGPGGSAQRGNEDGTEVVRATKQSHSRA